YGQTRFLQALAPCGDALAISEIGIEEIPARAKDAPDFRQKPVERRIAVRGFNINHCVKRTIIEWQVLGITNTEFQTVHAVPVTAQLDSIFRKIHADHAYGLQI